MMEYNYVYFYFLFVFLIPSSVACVSPAIHYTGNHQNKQMYNH